MALELLVRSKENGNTQKTNRGINGDATLPLINVLILLGEYYHYLLVEHTHTHLPAPKFTD